MPVAVAAETWPGEPGIMKRVIVVGLDGLEPRIAESMLHSGELSNLAKLSESEAIMGPMMKTMHPTIQGDTYR